MDLDLQTTTGIVSTKFYDKRDNSEFEIYNFSFLDGDVPDSPSYGIKILQLTHFARLCSHVDDFNNRNKFVTSNLLKQRLPVSINSVKLFVISFITNILDRFIQYLFNDSSSTQHIRTCILCYLVYKSKINVGKPNLGINLKKIIKCYKRVGYSMDIMWQSSCLIVNPITINSYDFLFHCTTDGQAAALMAALM